MRSFSDVTQTADGLSDVTSILAKASSLNSSFSAVAKQAEQGKSAAGYISKWFENGMAATQTKLVDNATEQNVLIDGHGALFRKYDPITDRYDDTQIKIVNSTIAVTDDGWETTKTAIGKVYYEDPVSGELVEVFGVNAETLIGKLILGEELEIANESGSLQFNKDGFIITTDPTNPNAPAFKVYKSNGNIILDVAGKLKYNGSNLSVNGSITTNVLNVGNGSLKYDSTNGLVLSGNLTATNGTITGASLVGESININASNDALYMGMQGDSTMFKLYASAGYEAFEHLYDSQIYMTPDGRLMISCSEEDFMQEVSNSASLSLTPTSIIVDCALEAKTAYTSFTGNVVSDSTVVVVKKLGWCQVFGALKPTSAGTSWVTILDDSKVPPPQHGYAIYQEAMYWASSYTQPLRIRIGTSGGLDICRGYVGGSYGFSITYPIEQ